MPTGQEPAADHGRAVRRPALVLAAMTLANAMVLVDQTAVPLTLADIMRTYDVGSQQVQWVLNGSLVSLAALLVVGGQLGDLFGRRRIFLIGTLVFAVASGCAAFAPTFGLLIACRLVQGAAGAMMLPTTVALVSATFAGPQRGAALGTMGGIAAVAGAGGPVVGGLLTFTLGWPAVFLINVPLAVIAVALTWIAVPADSESRENRRVDIVGAVLLAVGVTGLVTGLSQSQNWGWTSPFVWMLLAVAVAAGVAFVAVERRLAAPLVDLDRLRRSPGYRTGVISQGIAGMAEMGLGVILPLLLILNLRMSPGLAGLALLPASLPLIVLAPLVGRWYDRAGTRPPMLTGYVLLAGAGVLLAFGGFTYSYWLVLPGLLCYGSGLAIVLTVNDPVSLSDVPGDAHGEAAGVSATAEQFGGAIGIALFYLVFHNTYVTQLRQIVDRSPLTDLSDAQSNRLENELLAAESTGLRLETFDPLLRSYLHAAGSASARGYAVAFLGVTLIAVAGCLLAWRAKPINQDPPTGTPSA